MTTSLHRRFVRGFFAQGFGQVITLAVQILGVPIFLSYWGIPLYKDWLLLSAVMGYLQISDLSFGTAAANEMTMLESAGKRDQVQRIYDSAFLFVSGACVIIAVVSLPIIYFVPLHRLLHLSVVQEPQAKMAMLLLTLQIMFTQMGGIYWAAYRCAGQFAIGTISANLLRLAEFVAVMATVICHGGVVAASAAFLITRIAGCIATWAHLRFIAPWLRLGYKEASWVEMKRMMLPALSFNAFPIGQVMNVQGVLLIVNALGFPDIVVVLLNTTRAMSRVLYQFAMVVSGIVWDELSRAFGVGNLQLARRIHRRACQIALWGMAAFGLLLAFVAVPAYSLWTHHSVHLHYPLFLVLLVVSGISGLWTVSYVVPVSFNRHNRLAVIYAIVMTATLPVTWIGGRFFGLMGIGFGLLLIEILMAFFVIRISLHMLNEDASAYWGTLAQPPVKWLWHRLTSMYGPKRNRETTEVFDEEPTVVATVVPSPTVPEFSTAAIARAPGARNYQVTLGTLGRFHTFDLARQLLGRGLLAEVFSGYPWFKLKGDQVPKEMVHCYPAFQMLAILSGHSPMQNIKVQQGLEWRGLEGLDRYIARALKPCDIYIALASVGLHSGRRAKELGAAYVCDRPCTHIRTQDELLRAAFDAAGIPFAGIDPRVIDKEEAEYAQADMILVPSTFSRQTFLDRGFDPGRMLMSPYGVDFTKFSPVDEPDPQAFNVLFVGAASVRKGTPTLLESFAKLRHPRKKLTLIGAVLHEVKPLVEAAVRNGDVEVMGIQPKHVLRKEMSRSHVLTLPSIEDGFGLVMAEAMACGCPVIASDHTGARDLFQDQREGYIFPASNVDALTNSLQRLADEPELRNSMAVAAKACVHDLGGWTHYAEIILEGLDRLQARRLAAAS